ncbi:Crp/Fnr family transcriptional regulator [Shewanella sp. 202IG2-18]|uniref:Crp/Fnr family transcriptional regulator n=1 Tax=Parashewanella hymeniacidonis TaxID=2807618 RepID=UPI00195FD817|nr:helix-turn-helix domain-containing protein [Parashewanella hymeniacidonis]MBM7070667.1 Crp/Fnr family transcriptional regulator [Parashewanella hymeniacidonis]
MKSKFLLADVERFLFKGTSYSDDFCEKLIKIAKVEKTPKGKLSALKNKHLNGINFIMEGTVIVGICSPNLKTVNFMVLGKSESFGEFEASNINQPFFIIEIEKAKVLHLSTLKLKEIADSNNEFYKWHYYLNLTPKSKWLQSQLIMNETLENKIAYLLIELVIHSDTHQIKLSQQAISDITGAARQRINQALNLLEAQDILKLSRGNITIRDLSQLTNKLNNVDLSFRDPRKLLKQK